MFDIVQSARGRVLKALGRRAADGSRDSFKPQPLVRIQHRLGEHNRRGELDTLPSSSADKKLSLTESDGCGLFGGESATDTKTVAQSEHSGTTEEHSNDNQAFKKWPGGDKQSRTQTDTETNRMGGGDNGGYDGGTCALCERDYDGGLAEHLQTECEWGER